MREAVNSSTSRVVTPGWMKAATSLSTRLATAQAGRMVSKSRWLFNINGLEAMDQVFGLRLILLLPGAG